MSVVDLVRPELRALKPYAAAAQVENTIRLNANEAPWKSGNDRFRRALNRYPEIRPTRLTEALAARYACAPDTLLVTRGTSEAIDLLIRVFCRAGIDSIVTPSPTFSMYGHYATVQGARLIECPTDREHDFKVDIDALLDRCDATTKLVFVCTPNNPTGNAIPRPDLCRLLEQRAGLSAVVVDEAYIEFANTDSMIEYLDRYENLVVLRTLSKALAYAGARCGSIIAARPVIEILDAVQAPYAMATPVVECVEDALLAESLDEADRWAMDIVAEREQLMNALAGYAFVRRVWPSSANFFLIEVDDAAQLLEHCASHGILLRMIGNALSDCIRVTVGSADDNRRLLDAFSTMESG